MQPDASWGPGIRLLSSAGIAHYVNICEWERACLMGEGERRGDLRGS